MSSSATVQIRVDEQTKNQAKQVFNALHLNMSEAICMFLRQVVLNQGIPFEIKIPNALTQKTLEKSEQGIDVHTASSIDELFMELDA
jgi:DNA-damage-inducible protein J